MKKAAWKETLSVIARYLRGETEKLSGRLYTLPPQFPRSISTLNFKFKRKPEIKGQATWLFSSADSFDHLVEVLSVICANVVASELLLLSSPATISGPPSSTTKPEMTRQKAKNGRW